MGASNCGYRCEVEGKRWTRWEADGDRASRGWSETLAQVVFGPDSDEEKETHWKSQTLSTTSFIVYVIWSHCATTLFVNLLLYRRARILQDERVVVTVLHALQALLQCTAVPITSNS